MIIFHKVFMAGPACVRRLAGYVSGKRRLWCEARALRATYGRNAAGIAQEMGADCAQAGALADAIFWLRMAQHLAQR